MEATDAKHRSQCSECVCVCVDRWVDSWLPIQQHVAATDDSKPVISVFTGRSSVIHYWCGFNLSSSWVINWGGISHGRNFPHVRRELSFWWEIHGDGMTGCNIYHSTHWTVNVTVLNYSKTTRYCLSTFRLHRSEHNSLIPTSDC